MSILQENVINKRGVFKRKNIFGEKEPNIFFNSNIKSINLPNFYFTNFIDSKRSPMVKFLKSQKYGFEAKTIDIDTYYEIKNIKYNTEQKKIDKILLETLNMESISTSLIFRLKSKRNTGVHFFFLDDLHGNYEVLFIDLYHMVLPAPDSERGEDVPNPKENYERHETANYCLSNIFGNTQ